LHRITDEGTALLRSCDRVLAEVMRIWLDGFWTPEFAVLHDYLMKLACPPT